MPWTCCNKQLREHLSQQPGLVQIRRRPLSGDGAGPETHPPTVSASSVDVKQTDPFSTESQDATPSFLITNFEEK